MGPSGPHREHRRRLAKVCGEPNGATSWTMTQRSSAWKIASAP